MSQTALVVFAFNRPDHLSETLNYLKASDGYNALPLYMFIDGPRHDAEKEKVQAVVQLAEAFVHPDKHIRIAESNRGLRQSVISGLEAVFMLADSAIVLEDDICVHPDFVSYHLKCLQLYRGAEHIGSVSGYVIPDIGLRAYKNCSQELFLAPRSSSWGWSTWKNRWEKAVWDKSFIFKQIKYKGHAYSLTGGDKCRMLTRELSGKSSSWAILWDFSHFLNRMYCVYPYSSLVKNIGLDHSGTHSKPSDAYRVDFMDYKKINQFPSVLERHEGVFNVFKRINYKWYRIPLDTLRYLILRIKGLPEDANKKQ